MKDAKDIAKKMIGDGVYDDSVVCHYITRPNGIFRADKPFMSDQHQCEYCGQKSHYRPYFDVSIGSERIWLCANRHCDVYTKKTRLKATTIATPPQRTLSWGLFCEINGIGDVHWDITFEKIDQSPGKIEYMRNFAKRPTGLIMMYGEPGTGKTYMCMGLCELFTRTSRDCIFLTQKSMSDKWLETFKEDCNSGFKQKIENIHLLVIDDFGTSAPTPGFLAYFMELINTRLQWKDRGTVITTNLSRKDLSDFCGEALSDRLRTGQDFNFSGESRRKNTPL